MSIVGRHYLDEIENRETPLWFHNQGLSQTASGYGRKLTSSRMVRLPGEKRWRRVYVCQISNAGTSYVLKGKDWIVIS